MSRSRKKTPIFGMTTSDSEKQDKKAWHSALRSKERAALASSSAEELSERNPVTVRDVSSPWDMSKDGHAFRALTDIEKHAEETAKAVAQTKAEQAVLAKRIMRKTLAK